MSLCVQYVCVYVRIYVFVCVYLFNTPFPNLSWKQGVLGASVFAWLNSQDN